MQKARKQFIPDEVSTPLSVFRGSISTLLKSKDGVEGLVDGFERSVEHVAGVLCSVAAAGGAPFAAEAEVGVGVAEELVGSDAADEGVVAFVAVERVVADAADDRRCPDFFDGC